MMAYINNALFWIAMVGMIGLLLAEGQYGVIIAAIFVGTIFWLFIGRRHDPDQTGE